MCAETERCPYDMITKSPNPERPDQAPKRGRQNMPNSAHKMAEHVVYVDDVDPADPQAASAGESFRPYILNVVGQLARIAHDEGDIVLADDLTLVLRRSKSAA